MSHPWQESTFVWGVIGLILFAAGIVLAVVAAMMKDPRWLFILAWVILTVSYWLLLNWTDAPRLAIWMIVIGVSLATAGTLAWISFELTPKSPLEALAATSMIAKPDSTTSARAAIENPTRVDIVGAIGEMSFLKRQHPRETGVLIYVAIVNNGLPTHLWRYFLEVTTLDGSQPHTRNILVARTPIPATWMLHEHDIRSGEVIDRPFSARDDLTIRRILNKEPLRNLERFDGFMGLLNFVVDAPYEQVVAPGTKFYVFAEDSSLTRHLFGDHTLLDAATEAKNNARDREMMAAAAKEHAAKHAKP